MTTDNHAFVQEFRPTLWHRLGFGHAGVAPWHADEEDENAHYIITDVVVVADWRDRLRMLVTGRMHVSTRTRTEVPLDRVESRSAIKVMGWGWR